MDFIRRLQPTPEGSPPWVGISFKDPVESDELSAKLLSAYPKGQTLRERKHLATIHFLLQELGVMRLNTSNKQFSSDAQLDELRIFSDLFARESRAPSAASSCTSPSASGSVHSPGLTDLVKPSAGTYTNSAPAQPSSPNRNPQLLIWSAHDGRSLRQKTKRKMTQEERDAYKETRKRGACEKCKKNKGRCTHRDGEPSSFGADKSDKPPKRNSTGFDIDQPDKAVKTERGSDIHHLIPQQTHPFPIPISTQFAISAPTTRSPGSTVGSSMGGGRREVDPGAGARPEEYVHHKPEMESYGISLPHEQESWSPGFTRDPMEPSIPEYTQSTGMTGEPFSPQVHIPPSGDFSFRSEFTLYDPSWNANQSHPMGTSRPS